MSNAPPKRAPKGSIDSALLLRLPDDLREPAERKARKHGVSLSEWIRRAMSYTLKGGAPPV
jgi:predicted HicB family RNase H-like nuclease